MAESDKSIATIAPGTLLEFSRQDDLITAEKWNTVMATIKNAINNHAHSIVTDTPRVFSGTIKSLGATEAPYWEPSTTAAYWDFYKANLPKAEANLYTTILPQSTHQFAQGTNLTIQLYSTDGEMLQSSVYIQDNQDIIITSRRAIPVKFIIRGGI